MAELAPEIANNHPDTNGGYFAAASRAVPLIASQRGLAYASEVGEAGRPLVHKVLVRGLYGASFLYVGADTYSRTVEAQDAGVSGNDLQIQIGDTLLFHSIASMLAPAATIHAIVKYSGIAMKSLPLPLSSKVLGFAPTVIGLCSIPFIIHPIDHAVEWTMDHTVRRIYDLPKIHLEQNED